MTEADSKDMTECSYDDKPSTGVLGLMTSDKRLGNSWQHFCICNFLRKGKVFSPVMCLRLSPKTYKKARPRTWDQGQGHGKNYRQSKNRFYRDT